MNTFGERLKQLRVSQKLTQDEFVINFNEKYNYKLTKSAISQYENNKRLPEIQIIRNLSTHFEVSIDYLLCTDPSCIEKSPTVYINTKKELDSVEVEDLFKAIKGALEFNEKFICDGKILTESSRLIAKSCLDVAFELIKKNQ